MQKSDIKLGLQLSSKTHSDRTTKHGCFTIHDRKTDNNLLISRTYHLHWLQKCKLPLHETPIEDNNFMHVLNVVAAATGTNSSILGDKI
ncbi:hypothetical protein PybrP1_008924 [[Pythium] brassicae (nom. inval.)]|nr:hypothetical protein PybrP1_008924 [[Pythium] brassicae (nom. inval.)]